MPSVATNVQLAAVAAFLAACVEHAFASYGYVLPPDISTGLPGFIAIVVAHGYDVITGENKKCPPDANTQGDKPHGDGS